MDSPSDRNQITADPTNVTDPAGQLVRDSSRLIALLESIGLHYIAHPLFKTHAHIQLRNIASQLKTADVALAELIKLQRNDGVSYDVHAKANETMSLSELKREYDLCAFMPVYP